MHYWGMHAFWWIFWIVVIISVFIWMQSTSNMGQQRGEHKRTPLEILQRRYAAGEMTTEEYRERKRVLQNEVDEEGEA